MPYPPSSASVETTLLAPTLGRYPDWSRSSRKCMETWHNVRKIDQATSCERQDTATIAHVYDDRPGSLYLAIASGSSRKGLETTADTALQQIRPCMALFRLESTNQNPQSNSYTVRYKANPEVKSWSSRASYNTPSISPSTRKSEWSGIRPPYTALHYTD